MHCLWAEQSYILHTWNCGDFCSHGMKMARCVDKELERSYLPGHLHEHFSLRAGHLGSKKLAFLTSHFFVALGER